MIGKLNVFLFFGGRGGIKKTAANVAYLGICPAKGAAYNALRLKHKYLKTPSLSLSNRKVSFLQIFYTPFYIADSISLISDCKEKRKQK